MRLVNPTTESHGDKWLGRWLAAAAMLGDIVRLYVGMARRRRDGSVLRDPRPGS